MRIVCLIENSPGAEGIRCEHGLSVYIETARHKLLADTGASGAALDNAALLDVDLTQVDTLFLSHGHYDHAGGILAFSEINPDAAVYMQRSAGLDYYGRDPGGNRYIGIDKAILKLPTLNLLDGSAVIDEEISVMAEITGRRRRSNSNLRLLRRDGVRFVPDCFDHEQAIVICQDGKYLLFSGCAHNGILNFLDRFQQLYGQDPALVISGFHFMKSGAYTPEELRDIELTAQELASMDTVFYTGHCTGLPAYGIMRTIMGEKLRPLYSGLEISSF